MAQDTTTLPPGQHLRYSLTRNMSRASQIGVMLVIAAILCGIGAPILWGAYSHRDEPDTWVIFVVGGGFALVGFLLLLAAIHQLFALRTPMTVVEIDEPVLARGSNVRMYVEQPGPATFESLRANLVGEEEWWEGTGKRRRRQVKYLGTHNVFDSGEFTATAAMPFQRSAVISVPRDIVPTGRGSRGSVSWRIEVWGKVRGRADFQHVFPIDVV